MQVLKLKCEVVEGLNEIASGQTRQDGQWVGLVVVSVGVFQGPKNEAM